MSNPTTLVSNFDGSLAYQDQSGSGAWTGVDPIRYDSGLWLEEATTNYVTNPLGANVAFSWFFGGGLTETMAAAVPGPLPGWLAPLVTTCVEITSSGTSADFVALAVAGVATLSAGAHVGQMYVWVPTAFSPTAMSAGFSNYSDATSVVDAPVNMSLRDQWQLVDGATATIATDTSGSFYLYKGGGSGAMLAGEKLYVVLAQVEAGTYETSVAAGSFGDGYDFTGTDNESPSTRAASSASVPMTDILNSTIGGVAFWATRQIDTGTEEYWITAGGGGAGDDLFFASLTNDRLDHKWNCDNAGVDEDNAGIDFPINTPTFFYMAWSDIDTWTYQGGGSMQTSTRNMPAGNWGGSGYFTLQCGAGSMVVHEFMMLSRPLDDVELATLEGTQDWSLNTLEPSSGNRILLLARGRR